MAKDGDEEKGFVVNLVMYELGQMSNRLAELCDDDKNSDIVIVKDRNAPKGQCAVLVSKGNIPTTESYGRAVTKSSIKRLEAVAADLEVVPKVAFVAIDEMDGIRKIRTFLISLDDIIQMKGTVSFIRDSSDGYFYFNYADNSKNQRIKEIKQCNKVEYFEWQLNQP